MQNGEPMKAEAPSETIVEQVTVTEADPAPTEKKNGSGMLLGLILCLVLAVGGVGFGVWVMMDKNTQVDSLNGQIATLQGQSADLTEKNMELNEKIVALQKQIEAAGGEVIVDVDTNSDIDTADYIYVGEWGLKIKKPEDWRNLVREYSYYNGFPQAADTLEIRESSDPGDGIFVGFGGQSCEMQVAAQSSACFMVGDKVVIVNKLAGELTSGAEDPLSETFLNHFSNPDNYSAI